MKTPNCPAEATLASAHPSLPFPAAMLTGWVLGFFVLLLVSLLTAGGALAQAIPPGVTWTPRESNRDWRSVAMSADGSKLVAGDYGGRIYTSTDSGVTWTPRESSRNWRSMASSADGIKLVAAVQVSGRIYTSTDSGVTWTPRESTRDWLSVASSADGAKLVAAHSGGRIYTSTDSGVTWTPRESNRGWRAVASSADGSSLVAVVQAGQIYTSTDSGVTWTPRESSRQWFCVTSSAEGNILVAGVGGTPGGQLYRSTDSGVTWTPRESSRNWRSVASSSDGSRLVAVALGGQIYISTDAGVTWTPRDSNRDWLCVASSADGNQLIAGVNGGGQLYGTGSLNPAPICGPAGNLVRNGSFEAPVIANNSSVSVSAVTDWTTTDSQGKFEIWSGTAGGAPAYLDMLPLDGNQHLEINASDADDTVSQVVNNLNTSCPVTLSFHYTGRYAAPADNTFQVELSGPGFTTSLATLTPGSYATGGWRYYATTFLPPATLTIKFHGIPANGFTGGAHIDCVSLIPQPPPVITCPADLTLNSAGGSIVVHYPAPVVSGGTLTGCTPPSGSVFPIGTTVVTCTATNLCQTSTCTFNVTVRPVTCGSGPNRVVNGGFETPVVPVSPDGDFFAEGLTSWDTSVTVGEIELWRGSYSGMAPQELNQHLEITANSPNATVSQSVANLDTHCPATLCFYYAGRPYYDNHFTLEIEGSGLPPEILDVPAYVNAGSWLLYTRTFTPLASTVKIKFTVSGRPSSGGPGGAHIDNVELRQSGPRILCPEDIVVDCMDNSGALVSYPVPTATSTLCPGPVTVTCVPPPGQFPIGITPVVCTATDACGNTCQCSFTVTVLGHDELGWKWARQAGSPGRDSGKSVTVDRKGNVLVTGFYAGSMSFPGSSGITPLPSFGGNDLFVAKYDTAGTLLWAVRAGGTGGDEGSDIAVDDAGNVYITGQFSGTATFESTTGGQSRTVTTTYGTDAVLAKYDPSGHCLWATAHGAAGAASGQGVAVSANGNDVFNTGNFAGQVFLRKWNGVTGVPGVQLATTGGTGQSAYTRPHSVAVDSTGHVYLGGICQGATSLGTQNMVPVAGYTSAFAARCSLNISGNWVCDWTAHSGHPGASRYAECWGLALDASGTACYLTGEFTGTANFGGTASVTYQKNNFVNDYFLARLNATNGLPVWAVKAGGNADSNDETRGIAVDAAGNPCVTGFLHANSGTPYVNEGPVMLVAGYNGATGALLWTHFATDGPALPNTPQNVGLGIATDAAGCLHVTGDFTEDLRFPPAATLSNSLAAIPPQRDVFVAKICPTCGCDDTNLVINGDFENPTIANNTFEKRSSVSPWQTTDTSGKIELWSGTFGAMLASHGNQHLEINSDHGDVVISQTICGLIPNCPITFSYDAAGRPGYADNHFTASIKTAGPVGGGATIFSETSNPYPTTAGVWQHHSDTVITTSNCITIEFHGDPATGVDAGAHIDNVIVTQCCNAAPVLDSDGDGIPDTWEFSHGLNPNSAADATQDKDGDGVSNLQEYHDGTDPNDSHSVLILVPGGFANGGTAIKLKFDGVAGHSYTIERSSAPAGPWSTVATVPVQSVSGPVEANVPTGGAARCFFRIHTP